MENITAIRLAIVHCKAAVEEIPGVGELIDACDDGSPWARAYMRCVSELKAEREARGDEFEKTSTD